MGLILSIPLAGIEAQPSDFPTPLDFGGVGNGIADDTVAVQTALDTNGSVYLADRVYRITQSLTMPGGSTLIGPGTIRVDYDTGSDDPANHAIRLMGDDLGILNVSIQKTLLDGSLATGIWGEGQTNLVLKSVEISGYSARHGIRLENCTRFEISDCRIHDFSLDTAADLYPVGASGIRIESCTDGMVARNRIERIEIGEAARDSISPSHPDRGPQGYRAANLSIERCSRLSMAGNHLSTSGVGVDLASSENCIVAGNFFENHWSEGIRVTGSKFSVISGNHLANGQSGIVMAGGETDDATMECTPMFQGPPFAIAGIVGSVEGGTEDSSSEGDTLARLTDGNFNNRVLIQQTGPANFSFIVDLLGEQELTDLSIVSVQQYRSAGQYLGGTVTLETSDAIDGPYTEVASSKLSCTRPPATQMIEETPTAPATGSEARRVALPSPVMARYVRVTSSYCLDNVVLLSEAMANHGPIVHRMRPLGDSFQSFPRVPIYMTDGDTGTYYHPKITSGTVDLDLGPYPAEIEEIRLIGKAGDLSGLPQSGSIWTSSADRPDQFDTLVQTYNLTESDGKISIPIPPGYSKRYVRIAWDTLQGETDSRTYIAEIEVDTGDPCVFGEVDASALSVGNVLNGNRVLNTGSQGSFEMSGSERVADASATGIDVGSNSLYNLVSDNFVADTQSEKTLEVGIRNPMEGIGNLVTDNLVTTELVQEIGPTPTPTPQPTDVSAWRFY